MGSEAIYTKLLRSKLPVAISKSPLDTTKWIKTVICQCPSLTAFEKYPFILHFLLFLRWYSKTESTVKHLNIITNKAFCEKFLGSKSYFFFSISPTDTKKESSLVIWYCPPFCMGQKYACWWHFFHVRYGLAAFCETFRESMFVFFSYQFHQNTPVIEIQLWCTICHHFLYEKMHIFDKYYSQTCVLC